MVAAAILFFGLLPSYNKRGTTGFAAALKVARLIPFGPSLGGSTPPANACLWVAELWRVDAGWRGVRPGDTGIAVRRCPRHRRGGCSRCRFDLAIEAIQLVIPGRDVDLTSVLLATFGAAMGATLMARLTAWNTRRLTLTAR